MIQGFTAHALVIYPFIADYRGRGSRYFMHMNAAATNLQKYLRKNNISYDCYITDDVARECTVQPDRWLQTLNPGDMFFVKRNCEGMDGSFTNTVEFADTWESVGQAYPNERGVSIDRRFELVLKRDTKARREIMKTYQMVILFKQPKSPAMRITTKAGSGVLYVEIDNTTFITKCYMSDMEVDPISILGIPNGNMPAYEWEV